MTKTMRKPLLLQTRILALAFLIACLSLQMPAMSSSETGTSARADTERYGKDTQTTGVFPIKIRHSLGDTTIPHEPQRIVTLGWGSEDVIVALGKIPVGMPRRYFIASGILPWIEERLSGKTPALLDFNVVDLEAIAALKPDLILAVNSSINEKEYAQLSRIAPTIARPHTEAIVDWREQTEIISTALGRHDGATSLVKVTDKLIQDLANKHPNLRHQSITISMNWFGGRGIHVYLPTHSGVQILSQLGMKPSVGVQALASAKPRQSASSISVENTRMIEADVVAMWADRHVVESVLAQPLLQNLNVMKRGAFVLFDDPATMWALDRPSVLSIPYAFPDIAQRLSKAIIQSGP